LYLPEVEAEFEDSEDEHDEHACHDRELDRRCSALAVDPTAPAAGIREPRADVEWVRGSLEHWGAV
jgi:hypothetical protein